MKINGYVNVTSGDEFALQQALAEVGPVSVGIDAAHVAFMFYSHGVYYNPKCGKFIISVLLSYFVFFYLIQRSTKQF